MVALDKSLKYDVSDFRRTNFLYFLLSSYSPGGGEEGDESGVRAGNRTKE